MKKLFLIVFILNLNKSFACSTCNKPLQQAIFNNSFCINLGIMLSAFFLLALIVNILAKLSTKKYHRLKARNPKNNLLNPVPLIAASMVLGMGLGGFIDGIVLHQVLQWHEMLSNKIATDTVIGKSVNMFWDGIFHLFCWIVTLTGIILLWKLNLRSGINLSKKLLIGGLLLGWGLFNIVEGLLNHHLLKLHFVRQASQNPDNWNYAFLSFSVLIAIAGCILINQGSHYNNERADSHQGVK